MTPEERAEKIVTLVLDYRYGFILHNRQEIDAKIAAEIADACCAAVEEERKSMFTRMVANCKEVKAEAYEDAAKIAEECDESDWEYVAKRIRARAKALEGPNTSPSDTEAGK